MSSQRDTVLAGEGDAWHLRNAALLHDRDWSGDPAPRRAMALAASLDPGITGSED